MLTAKQVFPWWRVSPHRNLVLTMASARQIQPGRVLLMWARTTLFGFERKGWVLWSPGLAQRNFPQARRPL
jgi:hypothetical protein